MKKIKVTNKKVLIIDDEPVNIRLLKAMLKTAEFSLISANNGMEGLKQARDEKPDIVLLDITMPGMNGYEVTEKLKSDHSTRNIPIILITALDGLDDKLKGIEAGADDFLSKPVNTGELLARILTVMKRRQTQSQMEKQIREVSIRSITDPLTGLYNWHFLNHDMEQHMLQSRCNEQSISLFFVDVDNFKHINDTYGHVTGDIILKKLSRCFRYSLRGCDMIARYGGDEFIILLPRTDYPSAMCVAEKLRCEVENLALEMMNGHRITISIGLTVIGKDEDFKMMLERADKALYQAKSDGKNRTASILPEDLAPEYLI